MGKYSKNKKQPLVIKSIRFEQRAIDEASDIHDNFSELVQDALDEKLIREQAILEGMKS